mgnify:CR=1 FL=1|tara:strand:+ start:3031 stop:3516 length:486 start_codon:yes stop_codon:yes gene_type:complete
MNKRITMTVFAYLVLCDVVNHAHAQAPKYKLQGTQKLAGEVVTISYILHDATGILVQHVRTDKGEQHVSHGVFNYDKKQDRLTIVWSNGTRESGLFQEYDDTRIRYRIKEHSTDKSQVGISILFTMLEMTPSERELTDSFCNGISAMKLKHMKEINKIYTQ